MIYHKFSVPDHFFRLGFSTVATASNSGDLQVVPNFNNLFLFNRSFGGSVASSYTAIIKSCFGYYSVLHVKGIGFKVFYFSRLHTLYFSLGYNHIVKYKLSKNIFVKVRKQYLLFFSCDKCSLGNSIYQIRHLRFPDPYRGKGIRFRFQIMNFKPGKQR